MYELNDAELDAVAAGGALAAGGLVNLALNVEQIDILRNADIDVDIIDDITVRNVANNNNVGVGAILQILGGPAGLGIGQR